MRSSDLLLERAHPLGIGGTQRVYRFQNGYGASVVRFSGSYGWPDLWELGVVTFVTPDEWHLTYDTPITDSVAGYLSEDAADELLDKIAALDG
jgi:hypothetical protein